MPTILKGARLAISPCPNDTFLFEGLVGDLERAGGSVRFLDIAELNALHDDPDPPDVVKISCASAPLFLDRFRLLRCGGAFADAVGPLVLRRESDPATLSGPVALPGWRTSAHILWRSWRDRSGRGEPPEEFLRFDRIPGAVAEGRFARGVVIHESRFTYGGLGLAAEVDLGVDWDARTCCPVPLGCLVVRRDRGETFARVVAETIVSHASAGFARPDPVTEFVASRATEMSREVQALHIRTYATRRSLDCGPEGLEALRILWDEAERSIAPWPVEARERERALREAVAGR